MIAGSFDLGFLDPLIAIIISFCCLGVLIYKHVDLGITLNITALLLALLSLNWYEIPWIIRQTSTDLGTISVVSATFGIMLLSQLYKETGIMNELSKSLTNIFNNPKLVVTILPAIIGLLPVAGGALMSAPLVEADAEKLGLKADKKTYVNIWFRHTIFPVYPVSQVLILAAYLTGVTVSSIIIRQVPVVIIMIIVGYIIGLWRTNSEKDERRTPRSLISNLTKFILTFLPILATIIAVISFGLDVSIAAFIGVLVLILISRPRIEVIKKPFFNWRTYGIALAAYGAFLLRNVVDATEFSKVFGIFLINEGVPSLVLLTLIPIVLAFFVGSPLGAVAISYSMIKGVISFTPISSALLYISSYLGYVIAPTHLCLVLTADYFRCNLVRLYRYLIPSLAITFAAAISVYLLA